jgi:hypothetical protein
MRRRYLVLLGIAAPLAMSTAAFAYWSGDGSGTAQATTGTLNPPTSVVATTTAGTGNARVAWAASTLGSGNPVAGYYVTRVRTSDNASAAACGTNPTALTTAVQCDDLSVADGAYRYVVTAAHHSWTAVSAASDTVTISSDGTAPVITHGFPRNGLFYASTDWSVFGCSPVGICGTASDPSGVDSVALSLKQNASGLYWGGSAFDQDTPTFLTATGATSWSLGMPRPVDGAYTLQVRATDGVGNTTAAAAYATAVFNVDTTGPVGVSISTPTEYRTATSVPLTVTNGTDAGAGVNENSGIIDRFVAPLANDVCGTFTFDATVTLSAGSDTTVADGMCYRYTYRVKDRVGNYSSAPTAPVVKIDTQAPVNGHTGGSATTAITGTTVYFRNVTGGVFGVGIAVQDGGSGPASATFPAITAAGWSYAGETVTTRTGPVLYLMSPTSYSAGAQPPAPFSLTGRDKAGNSTVTTLSFVLDNNAPTGGALSYADGYYREAAVPITTTPVADAGAGIGSGTRMLRQSASLTNGVCGSYGTLAEVTLTGGVDTTVSTGNCYRYQHVVADRVGNSVTHVGSGEAKVDAAAPAGGSIVYANGFTNDDPLPVAVTTGMDNGSGISTAVVQRSTATVSSGNCGAFGSFSTITLSSGADGGVQNNRCYMYRLVVTDRAGHVTTYAPTDIAQVDTSAPSLSAATSGGGTTGRMQAGDTLTLTFSEALDPATVPTSVTVTESRGNDKASLSIPDLIQNTEINNSYLGGTNSSGTATATVSLSADARTVTITLGPVSTTGSGVGTASSSVPLRAAATLTDRAGNSVSNTPSNVNQLF